MNANLESEILKLNPSQQEAVNAIEGPVLVVAGPGTGKTQVLSFRIANILSTTDAAANNILCLTFTESGVAAMRKRLLKLIGKEALYVRIHTFHSFCNEVILSHPENFSFAKELTQLDDLNRIKIIRLILDELSSEQELTIVPFYDKYTYQKNILDNIQALKREGVSAETLENICKETIADLEANPDINSRTGKPKKDYTDKLKLYKKNLELAMVYKKYSEVLLEKGFYDYEDMILFVIDKFKKDDELLAEYQEQFLYILVDEYQDTNGSQNELLKLFAFDKSPNIFAVGDDDQAIYRFQGANVENLLFFEKQFENVTTISLTTNYRSSQHILDLSSSLIDNNKARLNKILKGVDKRLKAGLSIPNHLAEVYEFEHYQHENNFIIQKIKELAANGISYNDIAVFYKRHADGSDLALDLINNGVPIKLAAGKNSLDQQEILQLINLLKVVDFTDKNRDKLLFTIMFYNFLGINRLDAFKLTRAAADKKISIIDLMLDEAALDEAHIEHKSKIVELANNIINWKADSANYNFYNFLIKVANDSGYLDYFIKENNLEIINSIQSFFDYVKNLNLQNKNLTLSEVLEDITLLEANKLSIQESDIILEKEGVNLMTAHKSKGLEYKYVFIVKFYDKNWGNSRVADKLKLIPDIYDLTKEDDTEKIDIDDMEDERRLFFVALTRAREKVYITYSKVYPSGNSTKEVSPSIFLSELDKKYIEFHDDYATPTIEINTVKDLNTNILAPYSITEEEYLKSLVKDFRLSASALNEYIECPLKFKFNCLIKTPKGSNSNLILGTAIHYAFEQYFRNLIKSQQKDISFVNAMFLVSLDRQLLNEDEYKQIKDEGLKILKNYFTQYKDLIEVPADVEYGFFSKGIFLELPNQDPIELTGKIDKVEWLDKENNQVRLVDYKTSEPKTEGQIKGTTKDSKGNIYRQLIFYKLLTDLDRSFKPKGKLDKYIVSEVQVDFLKPDKDKNVFKKVNYQISEDDIAIVKDKINDIVTRVRKLEFGSDDYPRCGQCEYCALFS